MHIALNHCRLSGRTTVWKPISANYERPRARAGDAKIDSDPRAAGGRKRVARKNAAAGQKSARGVEGSVKDASPPARRRFTE